ncbi:hypothetical protein BKA62DRAFT_496988 [Auriculariales sp. MPI-PUGE-AT-0066]|nr:hypothetical protein BKA62DRAFT_496988 [Auriculariales sp. MPI-PUGE-AT-0066]
MTLASPLTAPRPRHGASIVAGSRVARRVGVSAVVLSATKRFLRAVMNATNGTGSHAHSHSDGHGRSVRVIGSGTLFVVNSLGLDTFPIEGTASRAKSIARTRGGPAANALALMVQLGRTELPRGHTVTAQTGGFIIEPAVEAHLVAALGTDDIARLQMKELHGEGVTTRYCKLVQGAPAPSSWVLSNDSSQTTTVVHHNSLPNISHIEFVELLGPLLVPENYPSSPPASLPSPGIPRPSTSSDRAAAPPRRAPFDIVLFEGRDPTQTLQNLTALDALAYDRGWRNRCAFCLDLSRKDRAGMDALIRKADVVLFSKAFATAQNFDAPRPFLLSMVALASPHALLVVNWGDAGAALLSVPTREYFQASSWSESDAEKRARSAHPPRPRSKSQSRPKASTSRVAASPIPRMPTVESLKSGSQFWADGRGTPGTSETSADSHARLGLRDWDIDPQGKRSEEMWRRSMRAQDRDLEGPGLAYMDDDDGGEGDGDTTDRESDFRTVDEASSPNPDRMADETGAHAAFVAGMLFALSKRILPGAPFTPHADASSWHSREGYWRMEDCLKYADSFEIAQMLTQCPRRFATEFAGRKARRAPGIFDGLAREMQRAGWFGQGATIRQD